MARGWSLRPLAAVALLGHGVHRVVGGTPQRRGNGEVASVMQDVSYIWPSTTAAFQLAGAPDGSKGLEAPDFAEKVAKLAEEGYWRYVKEILPKELQTDPHVAAEYEGGDESRTNRAFLRWQKRAFSRLSRMPVTELNWDGQPMPMYKNITYEWDAFFKSSVYKTLRMRVRSLANSYLRLVRNDGHEKVPFKVFAWAEVYPPGSYSRQHTLTGAPCAGHFVARTQNYSKPQKLVIEDPRGLNPPFGRKHRHVPVQGELMFWPSWTSHMLTPNRGDGTNVYIGILAYPPGGANDFDWEDDALGDVVERTQTEIRGKGKDARASGGGKRDEL